MGHYICDKGHRFEAKAGESSKLCPVCGSLLIRPDQYGRGGMKGPAEEADIFGKGGISEEEDDYSYEEAMAIERASALDPGESAVPKSKEAVIKMAENKGTANTGKGRKKIWLPVFFAVSAVILVVSVVLALIDYNRIQKYKAEIEEKLDALEKQKPAAEVSVKPEATGVEFYLRQQDTYNMEFIKLFKLEDGKVISVRTYGTADLIAKAAPEDAEVPGIVLTSSDPERVEISGTTMTILPGADAKEGNVTIKAETSDNKFSVSFELEILHGGWNKIGTHRYFVSGNGEILKNSWKSDGEVNYYLGPEGYPLTGWLQMKDEDGKDRAYYLGEKGKRVENDMQTIDGRSCNFDQNGCLIGNWAELDGVKYYYDENGEMVRNKDVTINGQTYHFDQDGILQE